MAVNEMDITVARDESRQMSAKSDLAPSVSISDPKPWIPVLTIARIAFFVVDSASLLFASVQLVGGVLQNAAISLIAVSSSWTRGRVKWIADDDPDVELDETAAESSRKESRCKSSMYRSAPRPIPRPGAWSSGSLLSTEAGTTSMSRAAAMSKSVKASV